MSNTETTFLRIEHYSDHPEVLHAAQLLVSRLKDQRTIREEAKYIAAAKKLIASIYIRDELLFRMSTKKEYYSTTKRKQVWLTQKTLTLFHVMKELEMVEIVQDAVPPMKMKKDRFGKGLTTVYSATSAFHDLLSNVTTKDIVFDTSAPRVELKDAEGAIAALPHTYLKSKSYEDTAKVLDSHYELLLNSNITAANGSLLPQSHLFYVRKFTETLSQGGRFYSSFVNQPKDFRIGITFDGEPAGSLDFSQLHPTLILRLNHGIEKENNLFALGDVYAMPMYPDLPRSAHKTFINIVLNAKSIDAAARSIMTARWHWDDDDQSWIVKTYRGKTKQRRSGDPVFLEKPKAAAMKYIEDFLFTHPMFEPAANSGQWALLQLIDSEIIQHVLRMATKLNIPVLPVHDEVVIPQSAKPTIELMMARAFQSVLRGRADTGSVRMDWTTPEIAKEPVVVALDH